MPHKYCFNTEGPDGDKKREGKGLFVSSISSPQLHCTSAAPSSPSPLVSWLRAALMQEVWGSQRTKGPRFPTSTLHTAQKCILMVCVFYFSKCFGDPLGFFRKVRILFSPTIEQREKVSFKQVMPPPGSLHFHGGCASVCLRD